MKRYSIHVLEPAQDDLTEIYFYIAMDNESAALKLTDKIMDAIDTLLDFPFKGKIVPDIELSKQEFRMLVVESYIAFYKVIDNDVYVYRIIYGQRDYPQLL